MAEAIFNQKVKEKGLSDRFIADSAGTANYHVGENPDSRTIDTLRKKGIPVSHKGQQFTQRLAGNFDYLIGMDHSNIRNMKLELQGSFDDKVMLMRDFDPKGKGEGVPDPWYGGMDGFEEVYDILNRSIDQFIHFLTEENHS
ncbi:MAG: low molecular weight protein-tyrosine-phosphatase [Ekhidna sp.]